MIAAGNGDRRAGDLRPRSRLLGAVSMELGRFELAYREGERGRYAASLVVQAPARAVSGVRRMASFIVVFNRPGSSKTPEMESPPANGVAGSPNSVQSVAYIAAVR